MHKLTALLVAALLVAVPAWGQQNPFTITATSISTQVSADGVSNLVFKRQPTNPIAAGQGNALNLVSLTVKIGATNGYVMVFDATALPSNGAVTSCTDMSTTRPCLLGCWPVTGNGTNGSISIQYMAPLLATTGIVAGFSSTGCDTLTASTTAKFMGQVL